jgi:hypothetical protein
LDTVLVILVCILMVAVELALAVVAPQVVVRAMGRVVHRLVPVGRDRGGRVQEVR